MPSADDERWIVVDGRRWRRSDPGIPDALRTELVAELMAARRGIAAAKGDPAATATARERVQDAKVALGERGRPWWDPPDDTARRDRIAATIRTLLRHRAGGTTCPSDAARVVGGSSWRSCLPAVRAVAADLVDAGEVRMTQRGEDVADPRRPRGPVRIAPTR